MERCSYNTNGFCYMFGRRAKCEDCSEFKEKEEDVLQMTIDEACKEVIKDLSYKYY